MEIFRKPLFQNVETDTKFGQLIKAVTSGEVDKVTSLTTADPHLLDIYDPGGWTPLLHAVSRHQIDVVRSLFNYGANVDVTDGQFRTPLIIAAAEGFTDIVDFLLTTARAKVNCVDVDHMSALMHAAKRGHHDIIKLLLREGVDAKLKNRNGYTAAMLAFTEHRDDIFSLFYKHGISIKKNDFKMLTYFVEKMSKRNKKLFQCRSNDQWIENNMDHPLLQELLRRGCRLSEKKDRLAWVENQTNGNTSKTSPGSNVTCSTSRTLPIAGWKGKFFKKVPGKVTTGNKDNQRIAEVKLTGSEMDKANTSVRKRKSSAGVAKKESAGELSEEQIQLLMGLSEPEVNFLNTFKKQCDSSSTGTRPGSREFLKDNEGELDDEACVELRRPQTRLTVKREKLSANVIRRVSTAGEENPCDETESDKNSAVTSPLSKRRCSVDHKVSEPSEEEIQLVMDISEQEANLLNACRSKCGSRCRGTSSGTEEFNSDSAERLCNETFVELRRPNTSRGTRSVISLDAHLGRSPQITIKAETVPRDVKAENVTLIGRENIVNILQCRCVFF